MTEQKRALEEYLVASARLGDRSAMGKLVALRGPRLLVHATRLMGNHEEAQDVVQEAWIDIFRGLGGINDIRAFPAWATRVVTRRCAKAIGRKQKDRALAKAAATETPPPVESAGPRAADATRVRQAIAALPPDQSATVALFYLEDMRVAEVALAMDVPAGTVKTRLMHARTKLKQALIGDEDV